MSKFQTLSRKILIFDIVGFSHTDIHSLPRWLNLQQRIRDYQKELDDLGIRDYQVPSLLEEKDETSGDVALREMRLPFRIVETILLLMVSALPALFLNLPVGIIARYWALHRREKALAASKVKIKGMDVMLRCVYIARNNVYHSD